MSHPVAYPKPFKRIGFFRRTGLGLAPHGVPQIVTSPKPARLRVPVFAGNQKTPHAAEAGMPGNDLGDHARRRAAPKTRRSESACKHTMRHCEFPVSGNRDCTLAMRRAPPRHREAVGRGDPSLRTQDMDCRASLAMTRFLRRAPVFTGDIYGR
jgi:hypothetical protein